MQFNNFDITIISSINPFQEKNMKVKAHKQTSALYILFFRKGLHCLSIIFLWGLIQDLCIKL